jgi:hypothetical protein
VGVLFSAKSNGPSPGQVFWLASETLAYSGATAAAFDRLSLLAIRAAMHLSAAPRAGCHEASIRGAGRAVKSAKGVVES